MTCSVTMLLIFTRGFLLSRVSILSKSSSLPDGFRTAQYNRTIILLVDALRYDFVQPQPHESRASYHNRLNVVHDLLARHKRQCRLYEFIADPPTTTMQRLKGLTTGSLPTFVDAGNREIDRFRSSRSFQSYDLCSAWSCVSCIFQGLTLLVLRSMKTIWLTSLSLTTNQLYLWVMTHGTVFTHQGMSAILLLMGKGEVWVLPLLNPLNLPLLIFKSL